MRIQKDWGKKQEDEMWGHLRTAMAAKPVDWAEISDVLWWARVRDEEVGGDTMLRFLDYLRHHLRDHAAKGGGWYAGERKIWTLGGTEFPMRWIPAGRFLMGAKKDAATDKDEEPQHEVTITRGFWMGETPVTRRQYQSVIGIDPTQLRLAGQDSPVESVSWSNAAAFTNELNALEGLSGCFTGSDEPLSGVGNEKSDYVGCKGWRLPTEAEWEYACRAGTTTPPVSKERDKTKLMTKKNAWGLYCMLGVVWEWVYDNYNSSAYKRTEQESIDPVEIETRYSYRVLRGGTWTLPEEISGVYRCYFWPDYIDEKNGFRVVRSSL